MSEKKIAGDPNGFAGASEHSQQVALMAACAHYAKYFRDGADQVRLKALFPIECVEMGFSHAPDAFAYADTCERIARALEWFHAIPNGGTRGGDKRSAMIAGANMKAEGAKAGISDTCLPVARQGYHGFYIEMKAPGKLNGESEEQKKYGAFLREEGYLYSVFDKWHDAMRAIMWYLGFSHCLEWELPLA